MAAFSSTGSCPDALKCDEPEFTVPLLPQLPQEDDFLCGDVNEDGTVNVLDIIALISHIMGGSPSPFNEDAADIIASNTIDVLDIIALVNIIMQVPGMPCGCVAPVLYEGQTYATVQIGEQCWFRKNLDAGSMVSGNINQSNNGIMEKFCYDNNPENCDTYGGLYEWREAMQYITGEGAQGICPTGWHIASDDEWKILEGTIDSQYPVEDPEWDNTGLRGLDAGGKLKETSSIHWDTPNTGATNESGFTGLPGGSQSGSGVFNNINAQGVFWTSSQQNTNSAFDRRLIYNDAAIFRDADSKQNGLSLRCIKGCWPEPAQADAGSDQWNIPGTSATLAGNSPEFGTGLWEIASGTDGIIISPTNPSSEFQGIAGNEYTLSWTISTVCGSMADQVVISFAEAWQPCPGVPTVEYEGQTYNTVQIGDQCWFRENLNIGTLVNSNAPGNQQQMNNGIIEKYCFNNDPSQCTIYGGLYEWGEAMQYNALEGCQGICPIGWHIPSDNEWKILEGTVDSQYPVGDPIWEMTNWRGLDAGGNLKETGFSHWTAPNTGAINLSGFTALPAGYRDYWGGYFDNLGIYGTFWTSSPYSATNSWTHELNTNHADIYRNFYDNFYGYSVRCIKGCWPEPTPSSAGQDQLNVPATYTSLAGNTPTYGTGIWTIVSGTGGTIITPTSPTSEFQGIAGNEYTLSWTITTPCGSSLDEVVISFADAWQPCPGVPTVEYEGHTYNTVQIGEQCWFRENLDAGEMVNGNANQSNNGSMEKFCYDNNPGNCDTYGGLYEWREAMQYVTAEGAQGICPAGWHIASDEEWKIMEGTIDSQYPVGDPEWDNTGLRGLDAGGKLKETGSIHWDTPNTGATNESGFTCLPGGSQSGSGFFNNINAQGIFWTSSQQNTNSAVDRRLIYNDAAIFRDADSKQNGLSIRCIKGCWPQPTQSNAGPDQLNVPGISTTLEGNTPEYGTGLWAIVSGTGGTIVSPTSPTSEFQGVEGNEYTLAWTITTQCGSSTDEVVISFAEAGFTCGDPLIDERNWMSYNTVLIGTQCWMVQNLDIGEPIASNSGGQLQTDNGTIEKYCYGNNPSSCSAYGGLYEWNEAMQYVTTEGAQGICPTGWHIPTDNELKILEGTVDSQFPVGDPEWDNMFWRGLDAGGNLKETGFDHWFPDNTGATNSSGFTALPGGFRDGVDGGFYFIGEIGDFYTSSENITTNAWYRTLTNNHAGVHRLDLQKEYAFSVRCLKD